MGLNNKIKGNSVCTNINSVCKINDNSVQWIKVDAGSLTAHEQPVFECGTVSACWSGQGLLDLTSDPRHCPNGGPFKFGHFEDGVEHALWRTQPQLSTSRAEEGVPSCCTGYKEPKR